MLYASRDELENAKKKAWKLQIPGQALPPRDHSIYSYAPEVEQGECEVPKIGEGLGISAKRFPNIKGATLFYD